MPKYKSLDEVPQEVKDRLSQYFTNVGGRTFAIHSLPPELTGGALARYSRSKTGIQLTLINEFLDEDGHPSQEKGSELMDRVLNAFGDESVGELEGAHLGVEEISQLGTKFVEDRRIGGSPIEQSTRYVKYDQKDASGRWRYLRPQEVIEAGILPRYEQAMDRAFEVYSDGVTRLTKHFKQQLPREEFTIEVEREEQKVKVGLEELTGADEKKAFKYAYNFTIRCAALDVGRCLLPASTLTHLGVFGNGRFFTNLISYMKSHELAEARERGDEIEEELGKVIPTYIQRVRNDLQSKVVEPQMRGVASELLGSITPTDDRVTLVPPASTLDQVLSSALFPYTNVSLEQIQDVVKDLSSDRKDTILDAYVGDRETRRDRTGRGLEAGYPFTFDLVGCFGEYRDLERHRMLTQQRQDLTTELGFVMPPEMIEVGLEKETEEVVATMEQLNQHMRDKGLGPASQYATLFNHRVRWTMGLNLRAFQHMAELRTQPAGHFSYRSMMMEMVRLVEERDPWALKALEFVDYTDPNNCITRANEQSRIAGKNIAKGIDGGVDLD
jgi:thymidylate synthase ThyX